MSFFTSTLLYNTISDLNFTSEFLYWSGIYLFWSLIFLPYTFTFFLFCYPLWKYHYFIISPLLPHLLSSSTSFHILFYLICCPLLPHLLSSSTSFHILFYLIFGHLHWLSSFSSFFSLFLILQRNFLNMNVKLWYLQKKTQKN